MSQTSFDIWVYDQLQPNDKLTGSHKKPNHVPSFILKLRDSVNYPDRDELTDEEKNIKSDEYLKTHGL